MEQIPIPAKERLLSLMRILEQTKGRTLSSAQIEALTGWSSNTIRKDISYLGDDNSVKGSAVGYELEALLPAIRNALGLNKKRKFCIVGLGRLGSAYLNLENFDLGEFELAAGFDINVNRTEILPSPVPLYPAFKFGEVIKRFGIEIALLCVPPAQAQSAAEKLAAAGIRGIVNFAPTALNLSPEIAVQNVYMVDQLRAIALKITPQNAA